MENQCGPALAGAFLRVSLIGPKAVKSSFAPRPVISPVYLSECKTSAERLPIAETEMSLLDVEAAVLFATSPLNAVAGRLKWSGRSNASVSAFQGNEANLRFRKPRSGGMTDSTNNILREGAIS
jgi:hypothetical protein